MMTKLTWEDEVMVENAGHGWFVIDKPYDEVLAGPFKDLQEAKAAREDAITAHYERMQGADDGRDFTPPYEP